MSILVYKQRHKNPTEANTPKLNYEHIRYIATRPGVSKNENMRHGLFGCTEPEKGLTEFESWKDIARTVREMSYRRINIFRGIISFAPETASELGLTNHKAWQEYIEEHIKTLAEKNGILPHNLQWTAAHHNERCHPHIHIVFWDKNQSITKQYVSPEIPKSIRIQLIKDTFADKIRLYLADKDNAKTALSDITDKTVKAFEKYITEPEPEKHKRFQKKFGRIDEAEDIKALDGLMSKEDIEAFIPLLFELKEKLPKKGRLYYKLLPEELKKQVDALVEKLKKQNNYINIRVDEYAESKTRLAMLYDTNPDNISAHRKNAVEEADRLIANKILRAVKSMLDKDRQIGYAEYTKAKKAYYAEELLCEILIMLEQNIIDTDEDCDIKAKAFGTELSKAAKKEWYLRHKDRGMEL